MSNEDEYFDPTHKMIQAIQKDFKVRFNQLADQVNKLAQDLDYERNCNIGLDHTVRIQSMIIGFQSRYLMLVSEEMKCLEALMAKQNPEIKKAMDITPE